MCGWMQNFHVLDFREKVACTKELSRFISQISKEKQWHVENLLNTRKEKKEKWMLRSTNEMAQRSALAFGSVVPPLLQRGV
jgi:Uri superfamily endonuclease